MLTDNARVRTMDRRRPTATRVGAGAKPNLKP